MHRNCSFLTGSKSYFSFSVQTHSELQLKKKKNDSEFSKFHVLPGRRKEHYMWRKPL